MTGAAEAVECINVRVDWFNEVIGKIPKAKDHQKLVHTTNLIREHIEDLQIQLNTLTDELKHAEMRWSSKIWILLIWANMWCGFLVTMCRLFFFRFFFPL